MLFEDQIEQIKEGLQLVQARAQESSLLNNATERYNSFSPAFQKIILITTFAIVLFAVLAAPVASYKASVENMADFKIQKNITQKVINFSKNSSNFAPQPKKFFTSSLSQEVNRLSGSYSIKLLPEGVLVPKLVTP